MVKITLKRNIEKQTKKLIVTPEPGAIFKITSEPDKDGLALCALLDGVYTLPDGQKAYAKNVKWAYIDVNEIAKAVNMPVKGKVVLYYVNKDDMIEVNG